MGGKSHHAVNVGGFAITTKPNNLHPANIHLGLWDRREGVEARREGDGRATVAGVGRHNEDPVNSLE